MIKQRRLWQHPADRFVRVFQYAFLIRPSGVNVMEGLPFPLALGGGA
ncbi:MAG: hypothetical protein PHR21_05270 [Oscillospiraceae bacterium]|nr:hypothetical protein [Oscillospiraceae bacterium]MDD4368531.1 hypothetical protein [Oscillospiraceae bacterium]